MKECLADDRHRIALTDLVLTLGDDLSRRVAGPEFPVNMTARLTEQGVWERVGRFEEASRVAGAAVAAGCYYGADAQNDLWCRLLEAVGNPGGDRNGNTMLLDLRRYPALFLLHAGGIAATAAGRYGILLALLTRPKMHNARTGEDQSPLVGLAAYRVIDGDLVKKVLNKRWYTPVSEHLFTLLREPLRPFLADDRRYERCFDRSEYLRCLLEVDQTGGPRSVGRFGWRWKDPNGGDVRKEVEADEARAGRTWPLYEAGWFAGRPEQFRAAKAAVDEMVAGLNWM